MVDPVSVLPLLDCLHCHALVSSPVTLFCGHTLCASHILTKDHGQTLRLSPVDPRPASSAGDGDGDGDGGSIAARAAPASSNGRAARRAGSRPSGPPIHNLNSIPVVCPLATCTVFAQPSQQQQQQQPQQNNTNNNNNTNHNNSLANPLQNVPVAYPTLAPSPTHPDIRTDSRIANITALVVRAVEAVEAVETAAPSAAPRLELEPEPEPIPALLPDPATPEHDVDSDDESIDYTDTVPEPTRPPLSTSHPAILQPRSASSTPPPCPLTSLSRRRHTPPTPTHSTPPPPRKRQKTEKYGTLTSTDPAITPTPTAAASKLERELLDLLTCEICFTLLYEPITTPCQHVGRLFVPSY